jgi:hypothetical protein
MMWPCIWLLFLPIPQSNFLQWLSGMTYTEMIRYHRCAARNSGCFSAVHVAAGWALGITLSPYFQTLLQLAGPHHHGCPLPARLAVLPVLGAEGSVSGHGCRCHNSRYGSTPVPRCRLHAHRLCLVPSPCPLPAHRPSLSLCSFWVNFTDWSEQSSINFLAGSLAYIFGLILWVTSINWIRRRFFEVNPSHKHAQWTARCLLAGLQLIRIVLQVFYRSHLICFVLFTLFSCEFLLSGCLWLNGSAGHRLSHCPTAPAHPPPFRL